MGPSLRCFLHLEALAHGGSLHLRRVFPGASAAFEAGACSLLH